MEGSGRISVRRGQHLVPLLASAQQEASGAQPWKGVLLESHRVLPGEIAEHEHPDLCLHLQASGGDDFEWWSGGRNAIERTRPGSLILIPPGTRDRLRWRGYSERVILSIAPQSLTDLARDLEVERAPEFDLRWSLDDPSLRRIVSEMAQEARSRWPLGSLYSDLLTLALKRHLLQTHIVNPIRLPLLSGGMSLPRLRRAMEYMNANLAEDVPLEAIAKDSGVSPSHFAHEFRGSTGQTPYQYFLDRRMAKAQELLKATRWPVQHIAGLVGFGSSVNFVRTFRQRVGATPAAWRRSS